MKRGFLAIALILPGFFTIAQNSKYADSLQRQLSKATTLAGRLYWMRELAQHFINLDNAKSEEYGARMLEIADSSRNREMMSTAYLYNADRYYAISALQQNVSKGIECSQKALTIARDNNIEKCIAWSYVYLARGHRANGDADKALNYDNMAISVASGINNDSLKVGVYNSLGRTYLFKNEKLLAFRNYLQALNIAEESKNPDLLQGCYSRLSDFYSALENYERAKDYEFKKENLFRSEHRLYDLLGTYNAIGGLYVRAKQFDQAKKYFEKSIALADTLQFDVYKLNSHMSIVTMYMYGGENQKALDYFNAHQDLRDFLDKAGLTYITDHAYDAIYSLVGKLDSANYYLAKAEPYFENQGNRLTKYFFYGNYAFYYRRKKDYNNAIAYYLKAKAMSDQMGNLEFMQAISSQLDSVYQWKGDYKNALFYNSQYYQYKDSLQKMAKEKDLLSMEIDNENKRKEREAQRQLEETRRSHNLQYMGITVAVAAVFILLVMAGVFSVSKTTIQILGFFAFIFLFEFIILLADNQIHAWTHGEPWKVMLFKIALIAILLPLHHWMEEKAIHYLTTQDLIRIKGRGILGKLFKKKDNLPMGNL